MSGPPRSSCRLQVPSPVQVLAHAIDHRLYKFDLGLPDAATAFACGTSAAGFDRFARRGDSMSAYEHLWCRLSPLQTTRRSSTRSSCCVRLAWASSPRHKAATRTRSYALGRLGTREVADLA
ncbi:hypothetical protein PHYSODRAFT_307316 [Phytophthora sojae]|uniref:Uncharacterized protein n=1 Tax=Phytophthora sojae (strain P6497) TaxID=1094619 RepID=G5ADV2_PHYSP|nr:hypothetical protein PHYSODRAFT_307316 [Phytophthora sojae]EGZ06354.1 hypothetical protein PHYSODRAFT_307316 [Phytophthora sojae]|eukprot:XP_009538251.1 hypothetical protein PHYSODRAFT_307316 [Phytophthora sojae]